jgi:hypothetical protein
MTDAVTKIPYKSTLTVDDVDKAADLFEQWIDEIVKNPTKETVSLLTGLMDGLDGLNNIRDDLVEPEEVGPDQ